MDDRKGLAHSVHSLCSSVRRLETTTILSSFLFEGEGAVGWGGGGGETRFSDHQSELTVLVAESRSPYFLQKILLKFFQPSVVPPSERCGKFSAKERVRLKTVAV